jgi:hypothetical protein
VAKAAMQRQQLQSQQQEWQQDWQQQQLQPSTCMPQLPWQQQIQQQQQQCGDDSSPNMSAGSTSALAAVTAAEAATAADRRVLPGVSFTGAYNAAAAQAAGLQPAPAVLNPAGAFCHHPTGPQAMAQAAYCQPWAMMPPGPGPSGLAGPGLNPAAMVQAAAATAAAASSSYQAVTFEEDALATSAGGFIADIDAEDAWFMDVCHTTDQEGGHGGLVNDTLVDMFAQQYERNMQYSASKC